MMGDSTEYRITQIKAIQESEKRKHSKMMEELRHKHVMEELKFMADNMIVSYTARLPSLPRKQRKNLLKGVKE